MRPTRARQGLHSTIRAPWPFQVARSALVDRPRMQRLPRSHYRNAGLAIDVMGASLHEPATWIEAGGSHAEVLVLGAH